MSHEARQAPSWLIFDVGQKTMITLNDCISILDQREDSPAFAHFKSRAASAEKLKKAGGYRATYDFKKDGVLVHLEYVERAWLVRAVHLYWKKESGFSPYGGELKPGLTMNAGRSGLTAALGAPSSSGGDGSIGRFGILNRVWDRWDFDAYSLRFDYEGDGSTAYTGCLQRPRDIQEFERRRPNKAPEPTSRSVTSRANVPLIEVKQRNRNPLQARAAPEQAVAHL